MDNPERIRHDRRSRHPVFDFNSLSFRNEKVLGVYSFLPINDKIQKAQI